jgi:tetratricopeptide (TPR) repeat protein
MKIKLFLIFFLFFLSSGFAIEYVPRIAFPYLLYTDVSNFNTERIKGIVISEFEKDKKYVFIPESNFNYLDSKFIQKNFVDTYEAQKFLIQGIQYYEKINFDQAIKNLNKAKEIYKKNLAYLDDNSSLIKTYLYLGLNWLVKEKPENAKKEFEEIIKLDYDIKFNLSEVSPKVLEYFKEIKERLNKNLIKELTLITDEEDTIVYFDGKNIGSTKTNKKIILKNILKGYHYIRSQKEGYISFSGFVDIQKPEQSPIKLTQLLLNKNTIYGINDDKNKSRLIGEYLKNLGENLFIKTDLILLGTIKYNRKTYELTLQLFDIERSNFSKIVKIDLGEELKYPTKQISKVVDNLKTSF